MEADQPGEPLARDFFERDTQIVARDLLGVWLLSETTDGLAGGPIVETEAYGGPQDSASHTRAGVTARTAVMFGEVGRAYVYLVYGMHNCLNVVAYDSSAAQAGAVLIRAIEPKLGLDAKNVRRCAGPALVCRALGITRTDTGADLTQRNALWLAQGARVGGEAVAVGPRIGVDYATGGWKDKLWRFWVSGNPSVSRLR